MLTSLGEIIKPNFKTIPDEMKEFPQWVLWKAIEREGKLTKIPFQPNGKKAKVSDAATYSSFENVELAFEKGGFDGIGFVLTEGDPFVIVDLDNENMDNPSNLARLISNMSYSEVSPSGNGIHVVFKGKLPENANNRRDNIEMYEKDRYMTFTGNVYKEMAILGNNNVIRNIVTKYLGFNKTRTINQGKRNNTSDQGVLTKMFKSKNGGTISKLFYGELSCGDHSADDMTLCNHLAYWTNGDAEQMDRLFRESALMRDKWERDDYRNNTIQLAISSRVQKKEDTLSNLGNISGQADRLDTISSQQNDNQIISFNDKNVNAIDFRRSDKNKIIVCVENTKKILDLMNINLFYDVIKKRAVIESTDSKYRGDIADYKAIGIGEFASNLNYFISKNTILDHLSYISRENTVNKVTNYFNSLIWDNKNRIQTVFNTLNSEMDYDLGLSYFTKWCVQAVRLARNSDGLMNQEFLIVLQGVQGCGKTSWLKSLFKPLNEYFKEGLELKPENKDSISECISHFVVELGELDATMKHEQASLKAFITKGMDELRRPYERMSERTPRQTILCATVNESEFLKDKTGNRRYAIIPVGEKVDRLTNIELDQFWAEIVSLANDKSYNHLLSQEESKKQSEDNQRFEMLTEIEMIVERQFMWGADEKHWTTKSTAEICAILGITKSKNLGAALTRQGCKSVRSSKTRGWHTPPFMNPNNR